jgi:ubiquinone/menaquinone biosynthesis C-methylase UbiE
MIDPHDAQRWDNIHSQLTKEDQKPSEYAKRVEKEFARGSMIADLGGGTGADAVYFMLNGHSVVVLDISEIAVTTTQKLAKINKVDNLLKSKQVDFTFQNLPLDDSSVDIVYSRISLNYFTALRTIEILKDIHRVLKSWRESIFNIQISGRYRGNEVSKQPCVGI